MLEKQIIIDKIEILPTSVIQLRQSTQILEDGVILGEPSYHRWCVCPGDDVTNQDEQIQAIANALWTPEVITAYQQSIIINEVI